MLRTLPLIVGLMVLLAGCGGTSPPPVTAPPSMPAASQASVAESPSAEPAPAEAPPTVPSEPAAVRGTPGTSPPVGAKAAADDVTSLISNREIFDFRQQEAAQKRIVELGDAGFDALRAMALQGTFDERSAAFPYLGLFEERRAEAADVFLKNLDFQAEPAFIRETFHGLALTWLGRLGPDARAATPKLLEILRSESGNANAACEALAQIGEPREQIVPAFIAALGAKEWVVKCSACEALTKLHTKAEVDEAAPVVAALRPLLKDPEVAVRRHAANAFGEIGPAAKRAVPDLTLAAADPDEDTRTAVAESLGRIGYAHPKVEAALLTLVAKDEDPAWFAAQSLLKLGISPSADPAPLLQALTHKEDLARRYAAELLEHLEPAEDKLPEVIAALVAAQNDTYSHVISNAHDALVAYAANSPRAAAEILKLLRAEDVAHRFAAAKVFAELGPEAKPYAEELKKLAAEEKEEEVKEALEAALAAASETKSE